jgi:hypothetical protein
LEKEMKELISHDSKIREEHRKAVEKHLKEQDRSAV